MLAFYGEGLLATCPTPKLEDHPLSFVQPMLRLYMMAGCIYKTVLRLQLEGYEIGVRWLATFKDVSLVTEDCPLLDDAIKYTNEDCD
jgi:hypothetical protein